MPTGALTIAAQSAAQQVKLLKGTLELLTNEYELSDVLPIKSLGGALTGLASRINPDDQPAAGMRNINDDHQFVHGTMEAYRETVALYGNAIKIDKVIQGDPTYLNKPGPTQLKFTTDNLARAFMNGMVNGDPTVQFGTDGSGKAVYEPAGLRYRLANAATYGLDTGVLTNGITGASIDLTGTITAAIANSLLDSIMELQSLTGATVLLMNFRLQTLLYRSFRLGGLLETTQDQIGRTWKTLFGMRVVVPKLKTAARVERNLTDTTNWILPYETSAGVISASATATNRYASMFFLKPGEDAFCGLTNSGLIVDGPVTLPPPSRSLAYTIEYGLGYQNNGFKDIAQLYGIKIG